MDTTDIEINFDEFGVCNHCHEYKQEKNKIISNLDDRNKSLQDTLQKIKLAGNGKKYDCIVGISGGVDSSYVAYLAKNFGLRALLVHLDNGWDTELAVKNVENITTYTGFDLYTLVINWEEFKDIQRSFFKADVIDLELISDHAIFATVYKLARKYDTKFLLSGDNFVTEAIMPKSWNWRKSDATNIKAIHNKFGQQRLKTFPFMSTLKKTIYQYGGVAQSIHILDYLEEYNKDKVINILESEIGWRYYGGKHYESLFTRFYQGYILPKKFNIDKRRAHLSTLINSGQTTRDKALEELECNTYPIELQNADFDLVCKKLDFTKDELDDYINRKERHHLFYRSDEKIYKTLKFFYSIFKKK